MNTIKKTFDYRTYWMGFAMLWIIFFHSWLVFNGILGWVKAVGYGGVDIFIFASGIGNYYSYLKDESPFDYLKRRIIRLLPSYILFMMIWIPYQVCYQGMPFQCIIGNLFMIQGFSSVGYEFNWYISAILMFYILTPYLATFVKNNKLTNNGVLILCLLIVTYAFWYDKKMIISVTRLPLYVLGMLCSKHDDYFISKKTIFIMFLSFLFGIWLRTFFIYHYVDFMWSKGFFWYPFLFATPFICFALSKCIYCIEHNNGLSRVLSSLLKLIKIVGECSFELYLIHIFVFDIAKKYMALSNVPHPARLCLMGIILSFLLSVTLNKASKTTMKRIRNRFKF